MAFSSIGVLSDCDCTTTSMASVKMPFKNFAPEALPLQIKVGSDPIKVGPIDLTGDAVSLVCGNGDGVSFCGSDGSSDSTVISFFDASTGEGSDLLPFVDWDGEYFTFHATDISQVGEHSLGMRIGLLKYPIAETRDWVYSVEVIADPADMLQFKQ